MRTGCQARKTADAHTGGPCARVAVGCLYNRGDHFGLEPRLCDLPEPGNQLYFYANANSCGLFYPLDILGNEVNQRGRPRVISGGKGVRS
jgi:hypothetical protein